MDTLKLYLIATAIAVVSFVGYIVFRFLLRERVTWYDKASKIISKVIAGIAVVALFASVYFINDAMKASGGIEPGTFKPGVGTIHLIGVPYGEHRFLNFLAWFQHALFYPAAFIGLLTIFFPTRVGKLFNRWIGLPVLVLEFAFLFNLITAINGEIDFGYKAILIASAVGISLGTSLILRVDSIGDVRDMNWKEFLNLLGIGVIAFLSFMPVETLATLGNPDGILFGMNEVNLRMYDLTELHRFVIYFAFLGTFGLYFLFRNCSLNTRKLIMLVLSLGGLRIFLGDFNFTSMFPINAEGIRTISVTQLPIHLCHTAMFITPLCVAFDLKRLFYFTYFINVFGAFMAMLMPNVGENSNIFSTGVYIYWVNHIAASMLPLLACALHIFERPKFKSMLWSLGFFGLYFVIIMFMNAWLSNYTEGGTDYLFINSDYIASKILSDSASDKLIGQTFSWKWGELTFTIRPLYQTIFFFVYVFVAFGMWFVYGLFYKISDSHYELHCMLAVARKENITMKERREMNDIEVNVKDVTLYFEDFTKRYGNSAVLSADHVNLKVNGGQIFGFLGPNGAGKSTCIKSAIGIQPITEGHIFICGYDVGTQPVQAKKLVGYVPDHYALYEKLTGREYINYIADLYGVSKEDRDARISKYVDLFELNQAFDNRMQTYSHGMKQKMTIMAALVHNPKVWILDEPLTGLDPQSIYQVKEVMKEHAKAGNIVFFSSHIINVVEKLCTRIAIIKKGHIVFEGSMKDVEKDHPEGLEEFYMSMIRDTGDDDE